MKGGLGIKSVYYLTSTVMPFCKICTPLLFLTPMASAEAAHTQIQLRPASHDFSWPADMAAPAPAANDGTATTPSGDARRRARSSLRSSRALGIRAALSKVFAPTPNEILLVGDCGGTQECPGLGIQTHTTLGLLRITVS